MNAMGVSNVVTSGCPYGAGSPPGYYSPVGNCASKLLSRVPEGPLVLLIGLSVCIGMLRYRHVGDLVGLGRGRVLLSFHLCYDAVATDTVFGTLVV